METTVHNRESRVSVVSSFPPDMDRGQYSGKIWESLYAMIKNAKHEIKICSPYFNEAGLNLLLYAFEVAAHNNASIKLLVRLPAGYIPKRCLHAYWRLMQLFGKNVEIRDFSRHYIQTSQRSFDYPGNAGSVHAKFVIVDSHLLYHGSADLADGLTTNFEMGVMIDDPDIVHSFDEHYDYMWKDAGLITPEWVRQHISRRVVPPRGVEPRFDG